MTFTKNIARKYAEAARRRAREIECPDCSCSRGGSAMFCEHNETEPERRECVAIWNAFCAEEQARMNAPKPRTYAAILPGVFVETT